jgi:hypothetical protein
MFLMGETSFLFALYWRPLLSRRPRGDLTDEECVSLGGEASMIWCSISGHLIQAAEKDAGTPRVVGLDKQGLVYSMETSELLTRVRAHLEGLTPGINSPWLALLNKIDR